MTGTRTRAPLVVLLLTVSSATMLIARDRIFVDQWSPTRSELFIADADGSNARKLVAGLELDYNASFSFDGEWVVFTSERHGSADIFRVRANGMGLERLTDSPAFDDQAALSPDGNSLAFVSTRDTGSTDIYVLDLKTRHTRNLTNSPGGDYRPSWSPDGRRLAFSSDRGTKLQRSKGNWEQVHPASVYVVNADGRDLRKISPDGQLAGSPKWSPDGARVVFYELAVADTFKARHLDAQATIDSRIVSVDVATGARVEHALGPGLKLSPQFLDANRISYLAKSGATAALTFSSGEKGSEGDIGNPLGRGMAAGLCITVARLKRFRPLASRADRCMAETHNTTSASPAGSRPCRPTDDKLPSASEPAGEALTIVLRWLCGTPMERTPGASSTRKGP